MDINSLLDPTGSQYAAPRTASPQRIREAAEAQHPARLEDVRAVFDDIVKAVGGTDLVVAWSKNALDVIVTQWKHDPPLQHIRVVIDRLLEIKAAVKDAIDKGQACHTWDWFFMQGRIVSLLPFASVSPDS